MEQASHTNRPSKGDQEVSHSEGCVYCGLPIPRPLWKSSNAHLEYCCTGCRFAHAVTQEKGAEGEARWTLTKLGISIFLSHERHGAHPGDVGLCWKCQC